MPKFTTLRSRFVALPVDDVDTDQIIPARFLTTTARQGLGAHLFADRRRAPGFPLDRPEARGARVLVAGANFGCGSSREHAAWALVDAGFRAVVARSFADIFRANALENGLLPVALDRSAHARLLGAGGEITIDLEAQVVTLGDASRARFEVEPFARRCLLAGIDGLDYLLALAARVEEHEARRA